MPLYRESFLFLINTPTPGLFWTGHTDLLIPAGGPVSAESLALGGGDLTNLPDLEELINGTAQRVEIVFSGVSPEAVAMATADAADVPGASCHIGRLEFDENWQLASAISWEWAGEAQKLSVNSDTGPEGRRRSISLVAAAGAATRSRSPFSYFTDADQRRDFPDDLFFSHVAGINAGTSRRWGPAD